MKNLKGVSVASLIMVSLSVGALFLNGSASIAHPLNGERFTDPIRKANVRVTLETVATGLTAPNWGTFAPVGSANQHLFVTDQDGILWAIDLASGDKKVFLNVQTRLVTLGVSGPGSFDERGLLGVAFHPEYAANGLLYTYTSEPFTSIAPDFPTTLPPGIDPNHQSVVIEWRVADPGQAPDPANPNSVVDPSSARVLLRVDQPQFNHNAGALNFGPDGKFYIAIGDGGGADDRDGQLFFGEVMVGHGLDGNGQKLSNPLGKILRIDVDGRDSANGQYSIPADNPFVGSGAGVVEEIFAFGFRNPYRFSFDSVRGDIYTGDVGQNDIEEVDVVVAGGNYGWRLKEGSFCFDPNGDEEGFAFRQDPCPNTSGLEIDPIAEYDTHYEGHSVIGGFVYNGTAVNALMGRYVFGDYSKLFLFNSRGDLKITRGRLFMLDESNHIIELTQKDLRGVLLGFGQDAQGELYVLSNTTGTPFGNTGVVLKIVPATAR